MSETTEQVTLAELDKLREHYFAMKRRYLLQNGWRRHQRSGPVFDMWMKEIDGKIYVLRFDDAFELELP